MPPECGRMAGRECYSPPAPHPIVGLLAEVNKSGVYSQKQEAFLHFLKISV